MLMLACHRTCASCSSPGANGCLSCRPGFYLNPMDNSCNAECPAGFFGENLLCRPCHFSCSTCGGPYSSNCLTCHNHLGFNAQTKECLNYCPAGKYISEGLCRGNQPSLRADCADECEDCFGPSATSCLSCPAGSFLSHQTNTCLKECPFGSYISPQNQCHECSQECLTCAAATLCDSCAQNYLFVKDLRKCVFECPQGYYQDDQFCISK